MKIDYIIATLYRDTLDRAIKSIQTKVQIITFLLSDILRMDEGVVTEMQVYLKLKIVIGLFFWTMMII